VKLLELIYGIFSSIWSIITTISLIDIIDIIFLTVIINKLFKLMLETRAAQLAKGIVFLFAAYVICSTFHIKTMEFLLSVVLNNGFIAILIMFQPEMRRALEKVGRTSVKKFSFFPDSDDHIAKWTKCIDDICEACDELSRTYTGALIVIERKTRLGEEISTGTVMNGLTSGEIFGNLFYPKAPLHDGAVIIRDGMIYAAGCFLPKPEREEFISKNLGSRHRAAIGMSENSDALVVVVSEETGTISVAFDGELQRNFTPRSLNVFLKETLIPLAEAQKKQLPDELTDTVFSDGTDNESLTDTASSDETDNENKTKDDQGE